jgi:hypothetical protein
VNLFIVLPVPPIENETGPRKYVISLLCTAICVFGHSDVSLFVSPSGTSKAKSLFAVLSNVCKRAAAGVSEKFEEQATISESRLTSGVNQVAKVFIEE